jgi:hypothetical protein
VLRHEIGMLTQTVARSFDLDDDGVVKQPIEQRGGDDGVVRRPRPIRQSRGWR